MARFAASQVPNYSRSAQLIQGVKPYQMQSPGTTTQAGSAADAVSVGNIFTTLRKNAPDFQKVVTTAEGNKSAEKLAGWEAKANMTMAGIDYARDVEIATNRKEQMEAQAGAQEKGAAIGMFANIASAALPLALSDESTKHTIDQIDDALETLRELRPVTFFYKEEYSAHPERMHYGFIAQEYQKTMPDATYMHEGVDKLCIDTTELIALLVRANQQLETRVARLEAKHALAAV